MTTSPRHRRHPVGYYRRRWIRHTRGERGGGGFPARRKKKNKKEEGSTIFTTRSGGLVIAETPRSRRRRRRRLFPLPLLSPPPRGRRLSDRTVHSGTSSFSFLVNSFFLSFFFSLSSRARPPRDNSKAPRHEIYFNLVSAYTPT